MAQRADSDQPLSLIGDAAISDAVVGKTENEQQPAKENADDDQAVANDADQGAVLR